MSPTPTTVYKADSLRLMIPGDAPSAQPVPYGTELQGVYYDGYPQVIKEAASQPMHGVKIEKNIMVPMRDGVRIAVDVYRPDIEGETFPAILSWGIWGKDAQEAVAWNADKPQRYYDSPFWDGTMEAGNYMYTVPRGFVHVIPDPRGMGNSEGDHFTFETVHDSQDIYDTVEWLASQPWCNRKVGMMGPSSYSVSQASAAADNPPSQLVAIHPDELPYFEGDHFHGIFDTLMYHIEFGRHGNDSTLPAPNRPMPPRASMMEQLGEEELNRRLQEALEHPDIKYNTKWYSSLRYPYKSSRTFDLLLDSFHPFPIQSKASNITIPMYLGTPWMIRLYIWGAFHIFEKASTPPEHKKMIVYPPGYPSRPYVQYHDEIIRWYDYWLKGIDNGVMEEPPIKMFVMGANKWRFENEWPLKRTQWTQFYLHPNGGLSTDKVDAAVEPDSFTQPAPYLDPAVYCLRYNSSPMEHDTEVVGPVALYLDASIDCDDTNWMVDLVDEGPDGTCQLLSQGYLKAKFRAVDEEGSKPWQPLHPRQEPVPVPPGEVVQYAIAMMPTANVFKKGHRIQLIVRNQDDILSRLGTWGVYMLPFMQTVRHEIHFGNSHLLLPVLP